MHEKISFSSIDRTTNSLTVDNLLRIYYKHKKFGFATIKEYEKLGHYREGLPFLVKNAYLYEDKENHVNRFNEPEVIKDLLQQVQITRRIGDENYREIPKIKLNGGTYIIAKDNIPIIKIIDTPLEKFRSLVRPIRFEAYHRHNPQNFLQYSPETVNLTKIDLEVKVAHQEHLEFLCGMYHNILNHFKAKDSGWHVQ